ncbi:hypothetical protein niasHS_012851 [Heterodera schachtii]|uniref:Integrase catalytic domain-containing protein n=1 Tax=Heterodera schachtii TaxID=97005 RepID=A0ABD2I658_HETSC
MFAEIIAMKKSRTTGTKWQLSRSIESEKRARGFLNQSQRDLPRWALILASYDFTIKYVKSENFGQADVLSRLIASKRSEEDVVVAFASSNDAFDVDEAATNYVHMTTLEQLPVDAEEIRDQTAADEQLQQVFSCLDCQLAAKLPQKAPLRPWPIPEEVFGRIHIDFAGPCHDGNTYLILVDALSKWPEITQMRTTNAAATIDVLNKIFHRYGAPKELVSDNGPQFSSYEFRQFCNGLPTRQNHRQSGVIYTVELPDKSRGRFHANQIRTRQIPDDDFEEPIDVINGTFGLPIPVRDFISGDGWLYEIGECI